MPTVDPDTLLRANVVTWRGPVDVFHQAMSGLVGAHERDAADPAGATIDIRIAALDMIRVAVARYSVPMTLAVDLGPEQDYMIQFPLDGHVSLTADGKVHRAGPGEGLVTSPGSRYRRESDPCWVLALSLECALVRTRLHAVLNQTPVDPLVFTPTVPASAPGLRDFALMVTDAIDRGVATRGNGVARQLEHGLADLLLGTQPHNLSAELHAAAAADPIERIRAVKDHVTAHMDTPLTLADLADVARCSKRSLQLAFDRFYGIGPMEYARRLKLAVARRSLERGDPAVTVADVAMRTGFTSQSQFARYYRERYGERPSDTIRRAATRGVIDLP